MVNFWLTTHQGSKNLAAGVRAGGKALPHAPESSRSSTFGGDIGRL